MSESGPATLGTAIKTPSRRFWFEVALTFLVFFVAAGDAAPLVNEPHYLCRLKHFWDPAYCRGDLFLESPDAHFTVVWLFGWITRLVSLETTAWVGRLLSWTLIAIGWQRLVGRVTTQAFMAPLAAMVLVYATREGHFAGEWIIGGFEAKTLAYGVVLFALSEAIDGRWNRAWLLLGVASAFHALVGGWSVLALAFAAAGAAGRPSLTRMMPGLVVGGVIAMAGVGPALALNIGTPDAIVSEANEIYVFTRLSHHLAPLTKPWDWIADRAGRHLVVVAVLALLSYLRPRDGSPSIRLITRYAWGAELISLAGLAIEIIGWKDPAWVASLLKYYWFRLADIAAPIAVATLVVDLIARELSAERARAAVLATACLALTAWPLATGIRERLETPTSVTDSKLIDPASWVAMCEWIEANTPSDAVFLTPRQGRSFKWHAQRAEVVTYKDVPQDAQSMVEWRDRYFDVFQIGTWKSGKPKWTASLALLGADRLRELGEKYGAGFVLNQAPRSDVDRGLPLRRRPSLPVLHRVGPYTLYELRRES
ncbi:MAG: DUF6798 domain-containing protein [Planctomycetota bacterium]